jgi:oxygen-dependent protoporphyrinogen oxidase
LQTVIIVGGGISGLSAAYRLEQLARETQLELRILLYEQSDRVGGVISSERCGDFLIEGGPDSLLTQKPAAIDLCRRLSLSDDFVPSNDNRRKTYVLHHGRLKRLPEGLMFVVPTRIRPLFQSALLSPAGKIRLILSPLLAPNPLPENEDISAARFLTERFGSQVLERLAEPLLAAVYGVDVDQLSTAAVFPQLLSLERKYGNLWTAFAKLRIGPEKRQPAKDTNLFLTLRHGIGQMVEAIERSLGSTQIIKAHTINSIRRVEQSNELQVEGDGFSHLAGAVIVATPAHRAGRILSSLDPELSGKLSSIVYRSVAIIALGYDAVEFEDPLDGFGFVVPRGERKNMIACTWVTTKYSHRSAPGQVLLRCFLGGARDKDVLKKSDEELISIALQELGVIMGVHARPILTRVYRLERCMPQYSVGHLYLLKSIEDRLRSQPGLFLAGNAYRGVGIPDCVQSGSQAASSAMDYLKIPG